MVWSVICVGPLPCSAVLCDIGMVKLGSAVSVSEVEIVGGQLLGFGRAMMAASWMSMMV
uniref:40S ribosomal protein S11-like n=1 Tax=Rhizophora mucronata TaxID=61149 RepID=A0A2P2M3C8_RHIMU